MAVQLLDMKPVDDQNKVTEQFIDDYIKAMNEREMYNNTYFELDTVPYKIYKYLPEIFPPQLEIAFGKLSDNSPLKNKRYKFIFRSHIAPELEDINSFKDLFLHELSADIFKSYTLVNDDENLLLICLILYQNYWDVDGAKFSTLDIRKLLGEQEHHRLPNNYKDAKRSKQVASFFEFYFQELNDEFIKNYSSINKKHKASSDDFLKIQFTVNNNTVILTDNVLTKWITDGIFLSFMNDNFPYGKLGMQAYGLISNVRAYRESKNVESLKDIIKKEREVKISDPFDLKNSAIADFCLSINDYLCGIRVFNVDVKPEFIRAQLQLFLTILKVFNMSEKKYHQVDDIDTVSNFGRSLRKFSKIRKGNKPL